MRNRLQRALHPACADNQPLYKAVACRDFFCSDHAGEDKSASVGKTAKETSAVTVLIIFLMGELGPNLRHTIEDRAVYAAGLAI